MKKVIFSWSGGKDSALALYHLKKNRDYEVAVLLTTVTKDFDRISMHGIHRLLLEQQAEALNIPLEIVFISKDSSNREYEVRMEKCLKKYKAIGISMVAFGDIFLEDLRKYREEKLSKIEMDAVFPIWKRDTTFLANEFIDLGFKAVISCVDNQYLSQNFAGRIFDKQFLTKLPAGIDPCGENGEFHSFVYDGPIFSNRLSFALGDIVLRDNRFYYCDVISTKSLTNNFSLI